MSFCNSHIVLNLFHVCCTDFHVFAGRPKLFFFLPSFLPLFKACVPSHPCSLMHSSFWIIFPKTNHNLCHSQGDQPQRWMRGCAKCCKMLKTTQKKCQAGDTGCTRHYSFFLSDSEMLLIFSTEHRDPVETRATSCLPRDCAQDIMQNLSALGSMCVVSTCHGAFSWPFWGHTHAFSSGWKIMIPIWDNSVTSFPPASFRAVKKKKSCLPWTELPM